MSEGFSINCPGSQLTTGLYWAGLQHYNVPLFHEGIKELIENALIMRKHYNPDVDYFFDQIQRQLMQAWVLFSDANKPCGVLLSQLSVFQGDTICSVPLLAGGDLKSWKEFFTEALEPWAEHMQADKIEIRCRKGFMKAFTELDYINSEVIVSRTLHEKRH